MMFLTLSSRFCLAVDNLILASEFFLRPIQFFLRSPLQVAPAFCSPCPSPTRAEGAAVALTPFPVTHALEVLPLSGLGAMLTHQLGILDALQLPQEPVPSQPTCLPRGQVSAGCLPLPVLQLSSVAPDDFSHPLHLGGSHTESAELGEKPRMGT